MGLLRYVFGRGRKKAGTDNPVGRIKILRTYGEGTGLRAEIIDGLVYPGYRLSRKKRVPIRRLRMEGRDVDFAVEGDTVDVSLEGELNAEPGDTLEVYIV